MENKSGKKHKFYAEAARGLQLKHQQPMPIRFWLQLAIKSEYFCQICCGFFFDSSIDYYQLKCLMLITIVYLLTLFLFMLTFCFFIQRKWNLSHFLLHSIWNVYMPLFFIAMLVFIYLFDILTFTFKRQPQHWPQKYF